MGQRRVPGIPNEPSPIFGHPNLVVPARVVCMTPKRIVVTGGAGFLGSHLCDRLVSSGAEVVCLDNFFTGSKSNVAHLLSNPRFEIVRHDVVHPILLEVDQIYNFACPASPLHYQYNPVKTVKTSVMGALNMLGLAKRVRARILQASTSEVYGDPKDHPQKESYWGHVNPIGPRSCYDEGKRVAETLMMDYHRQNGVDIRIVRIFNTYGPRMAVNDGRVVSNFIVQALRNQPITIYGDGRQTRSFCYVSDLIEGVWRLMNTEGLTLPNGGLAIRSSTLQACPWAAGGAAVGVLPGRKPRCCLSGHSIAYICYTVNVKKEDS
jgi:UDP-glucuronate decarboxylase